MAKGASMKFVSYEETVPKLLELVNLAKELPKHDKIILKVALKNSDSNNPENTKVEFAEQVLRFCLKNKNPVAEVFIAEGADGKETMELFDLLGYRNLAEKYSIGLVDLNDTEVESVALFKLLKMEKIMYPRILKEGFIISLPALAPSEEYLMSASLSNMLGAYPSKYYQGFFSTSKNKIKKYAPKYAIHDILRCKMPEFAIIDASGKGKLLAGIPIDMDRQAAKLLDVAPENVAYLSFIEETFGIKEQGADPIGSYR